MRRFLLFREGDNYDPALLAQTERNLRALTFLKSARVVAGPPHDGVVDVEVVTQDAWTTEFVAQLGNSGGENSWSAGVTEHNVAGLGKELGFLFAEDAQRTNRLIEYADPALFGAYWSGRFLLANNSDGSQQLLRLAKPFVSTLDTLSALGLYDRHQLQERLYTDGSVSSEYARHHRQVHLSWGTALSTGDLHAQRLTAGIDFFQDDFRPLPDRPDDILPAPRDFRYVYVGFEDVSSDFVTEGYVNRSELLEDFNLGPRLAAQVGFSPRAFGAPGTSFAVAGEVSDGWRLGSESFVRAAAAFRSRLQGGGAQNAIFTGTATLVWKHATTLPQTTVAQVRVDRGWSLDLDVQFFADGDHGLRGYHLYAFEGNRRVLVNVEHRIFGGFELLQLFSLGAAVFVDSGAAVPPGAPLRLSSMKTDAGAGLRISIPRADALFRLDCAYAFNADPLGRHGWLVSFSTGQAF